MFSRGIETDQWHEINPCIEFKSHHQDTRTKTGFIINFEEIQHNI